MRMIDLETVKTCVYPKVSDAIKNKFGEINLPYQEVLDFIVDFDPAAAGQARALLQHVGCNYGAEPLVLLNNQRKIIVYAGLVVVTTADTFSSIYAQDNIRSSCSIHVDGLIASVNGKILSLGDIEATQVEAWNDIYARGDIIARHLVSSLRGSVECNYLKVTNGSVASFQDIIVREDLSVSSFVSTERGDIVVAGNIKAGSIAAKDSVSAQGSIAVGQRIRAGNTISAGQHRAICAGLDFPLDTKEFAVRAKHKPRNLKTGRFKICR